MQAFAIKTFTDLYVNEISAFFHYLSEKVLLTSTQFPS